MAEYIDKENIALEYSGLAKIAPNDFMGIGKYFADQIKAMPAADVAPVRHERWDVNGRCTGCGGHAPFWAMASTYYESPYCFECGAKMDGDKKDG